MTTKKQLSIQCAVFNEAENFTKCLKPKRIKNESKRIKTNQKQMLCECGTNEVELRGQSK